MRSCLSLAVALIVFIDTRVACSAEERVPTSATELAERIVIAIKENDCNALRKLYVPNSIVKRITSDNTELCQEKRTAVDNSRRYYRMLVDKGAIPDAFNNRTVIYHSLQSSQMRFDQNHSFKRCFGIGIKNGPVIVELIDQAMIVDGKWYVVRLITERNYQQISDSKAKAAQTKPIVFENRYRQQQG